MDITDSPVYQLLHDLTPLEIKRSDRIRIENSANETEKFKCKIIAARQIGAEALHAVESLLGDLKQQDSSVLLELFLSYRNLRMYKEQIDMVERMPPSVAELALVQEQLAFALARVGRLKDAESVLKTLLKTRPSSDSFAALGRIYKERWEQELQSGRAMLAMGFLEKAIDLYVKGFEFDWREAYPGLNAVTLMEYRDKPDLRQEKLLPIIRYSMERRSEGQEVDYWDAATFLELAILAKDHEEANKWVVKCLALAREAWEPETTLRNVRLIREARERKGCSEPWLNEIEETLQGIRGDFDHDASNYIHPRLRDRITQTRPPTS